MFEGQSQSPRFIGGRESQPGLPFGDAHRDGKGFIIRADEILTAFLELQRAIHGFAVTLIS